MAVIPWRAALADAAATAVIGVVLMLPIVGCRTTGGTGGLVIEFHVDLVLWLGLAIFIGRLALGLIPPGKTASSVDTEDFTRWVGGNGRAIGLVCLGAAIILPFIVSNYLIDFATNALIYIMLGWGLNIVVGLAGLLDLGYVAFYAVGAYTFGLLSTHFGWSFWECLPLCGLFAAGFGVMLGLPVLRLRGDYLAIVTLGFGEIIRVILLNWGDVTGGPNGIGGIPRPSLFGLQFARAAREGETTFADFFGLDYAPSQRFIFLYFLILALALLTNLFTLRMRRLPAGRAWEALREDEIACRAIGINATNIKLSAFAIGAMFAGFAGAFFAARLSFISPESFNFSESAIILAIVVLGGAGGQLGVVLAALLLTGLQELGRYGGPDFVQYRMLVFGAAMVLVMVTRPRGLFSRRRPSILLGQGARP
jgi:branched-chain amino acid transport system permease protein